MYLCRIKLMHLRLYICSAFRILTGQTYMYTWCVCIWELQFFGTKHDVLSVFMNISACTQ